MSEVVVPLHGGVRVDDQVPEQLHPDDGVHEEEHSHQHAHVRQRLQLQTSVKIEVTEVIQFNHSLRS